MTFDAFIGGAGCGKTYQLMVALQAHLNQNPLKADQKVLALTFMHGSRRRLDARLSQIQSIGRSYECSTIDSFAWRIVSRWRQLSIELGYADLSNEEYESVCEAAGELLEKEYVVRWVTAVFPCAILDEAQDLTVSRLRIIQALSSHIKLFVAADEFQCLDEALRPNPACTWIDENGLIVELNKSNRTSVADILAATAAVRGGLPPVSNKKLSICPAYSIPWAGSYVGNQISWYGRNKTTAIITPATGRYADGVVSWVQNNVTKKGNGPHTIVWEKSGNSVVDDYLAKITLPDQSTTEQVLQSLMAASDDWVVRDVRTWLDRQVRCIGRNHFDRDEIQACIKRSFAHRKMHNSASQNSVMAMTVHGAKNREFDNVIILWPASTTGSEDQKRRLLYNAITRAKDRCLILVQTKKALESGPFV